MKNIIKLMLTKISRIIYYITPSEFKLISKLDFKSRSKLKLKLNNDLADETFEHFKEHFKKSLLFDDKHQIREYAIKTSLLNDKNKGCYYLEFGVFKGNTANYFSKFVNKLYCFDSFEGLKDDWGGTRIAKDHFNLNKKIPKLNSNIEVVIGWVEDTLDDFLDKHNPKINFVHMDMDTYSSTKFTLEKLKPYLSKNAIILFDELYNYFGWENGEHKALKEVFQEDEYEFKSFCLNFTQCCIQIK
jgi:hypothetical protein